MRIQYRHPKLYDCLIRLVYPKTLMDRFRSEVGRERTVLEIGAGYGRMSRYLDPSNHYTGIDLNQTFVHYGRRQGINLSVRDIFDPSAYQENDIFLVVDLVHHLTPERLTRLFDLVFAHAKEKVIVIEPAFVNLVQQYGILGKIIDKFFQYMDYDGFNTITRWFDHEEYLRLFHSRFGSKEGKAFTFQHEQ